jgi:hypothetical protein
MCALDSLYEMRKSTLQKAVAMVSAPDPVVADVVGVNTLPPYPAESMKPGSALDVWGRRSGSGGDPMLLYMRPSSDVSRRSNSADSSRRVQQQQKQHPYAASSSLFMLSGPSDLILGAGGSSSSSSRAHPSEFSLAVGDGRAPVSRKKHDA